MVTTSSTSFRLQLSSSFKPSHRASSTGFRCLSSTRSGSHEDSEASLMRLLRHLNLSPDRNLEPSAIPYTVGPYGLDRKYSPTTGISCLLRPFTSVKAGKLRRVYSKVSVPMHEASPTQPDFTSGDTDTRALILSFAGFNDWQTDFSFVKPSWFHHGNAGTRSICSNLMFVAAIDVLIKLLFSIVAISSLVRSITAVCSFFIVFNMACGATIHYCSMQFLYSIQHGLEENFTGVSSLMNIVLAGFDFLFVSGVEQFIFPIFPLVWSELEAQAWLVLQGSSSQPMLSSAFGAGFDAILQEVYKIVVMQFLWFLYVICISILSLLLSVSYVVWLFRALMYPSLMEFKLF